MRSGSSRRGALLSSWREPKRRGRRWQLRLVAVAFAALIAAAGVARRRRGGTPPLDVPSSGERGGRAARIGDPVPEADALEQQRDVVLAAGGEARISEDPEAPEPDALDQARVVGAEAIIDTPSRDLEAPDADALDQAHVLPPPEE